MSNGEVKRSDGTAEKLVEMGLGSIRGVTRRYKHPHEQEETPLSLPKILLKRKFKILRAGEELKCLILSFIIF